jgi:Zn-dependent peptidase ImmA (M78 family)
MAFPDLYHRLDQAGFDEKFIRRYVLPAWWNDALERVPETRTLAESAISNLLGISLASLRTSKAPFRPVLNGDYGLTRDKESQIHKMLPAIVLAQSVAKLLTGVMPGLPTFQQNDTPAMVRQAILEERHSVDLQGLLDWAWRHGIVVAHLRELPRQSKKFSGIAMYCNGRPVILLGSGHDAPPWLAFHLAYELGHVLEGQLQPGQPLVDSDLDKPLPLDRLANNGVDGNDVDERAKEFAMLLLTGRPDLQFKQHQHLTVAQLALRARATEQSTQINAGTLALIYGRSARQMRVAQDTLKALELDKGGRHMIAVGVQRHLPDELPEAVAAMLPLIGCI